jgi:phosphoribosylformimino-5-aminoimidazole carboxamide ribotide isomerase
MIAKKFIVIPAIDLKDGKCVRLEQGLMERDTIFCDNPAEQAREWERQGAERLHVVDLDGAFAGKPKNKPAIEAIVKAVTIPVQVGGGIRSEETVKDYFDLGVTSVILGTKAQQDYEFVKKCVSIAREYDEPRSIIVGIDAKNGMVAINGWAEVTDKSAIDLARDLVGYGVDAIIYTDIACDGMLNGPNIKATQDLAVRIDAPVIASGGVSTLANIETLMELEDAGVAGVITGKAIYTGAFKLSDAIALTKKQRGN